MTDFICHFFAAINVFKTTTGPNSSIIRVPLRRTEQAINKVKCLSQDCIHTVIIPGNMLLKDIFHLSFSLLRFAVPRLLVVRIHVFLIIDPTTLFLDIEHHAW